MTTRDEGKGGQIPRPRNVVASVTARLLTRARNEREEFQLVLMRYALERLLYRLGQSEYERHFVVKGAQLFSLWGERTHRSTHDLDLLGYGANDVSRLEQIFRNLCRQAAVDDGLTFQEETVHGIPIREDQEYGGIRIRLTAFLGKARISLQVDIGFGDVVTPAPVLLSFPTLLDFPAPLMHTYPRETVIAEKTQALVQLGIANTRMKDFYDLWYLASHFSFDGLLLCEALKATFTQRETPFSVVTPLALTSTFADDGTKQIQWRAFLRKSGLEANTSLDLSDILTLLREFLLPMLIALAEGKRFAFSWPVGGSWHPNLVEDA